MKPWRQPPYCLLLSQNPTTYHNSAAPSAKTKSLQSSQNQTIRALHKTRPDPTKWVTYSYRIALHTFRRLYSIGTTKGKTIYFRKKLFPVSVEASPALPMYSSPPHHHPPPPSLNTHTNTHTHTRVQTHTRTQNRIQKKSKGRKTLRRQGKKKSLKI